VTTSFFSSLVASSLLLFLLLLGELASHPDFDAHLSTAALFGFLGPVLLLSRFSEKKKKKKKKVTERRHVKLPGERT